MPDLKPAVAFLLGAGCVLWVGYTTPLFQHDAQIQGASLSTKTPVCPKQKDRDAHVTCGPCAAAGQVFLMSPWTATRARLQRHQDCRHMRVSLANLFFAACMCGTPPGHLTNTPTDTLKG